MWIALWPLCMLGAWQPMVTPRLCVQLTYYIQRWNLCTIYTPLLFTRAVVSRVHPSVHTMDCLPSAVGDREPVWWRLKLLISPICKCLLMPCLLSSARSLWWWGCNSCSFTYFRTNFQGALWNTDVSLRKVWLCVNVHTYVLNCTSIGWYWVLVSLDTSHFILMWYIPQTQVQVSTVRLRITLSIVILYCCV